MNGYERVHAAALQYIRLMARIGSIDPSGVLRWGDVRKVEEETRELCRAFADTPRFILTSS